MGLGSTVITSIKISRTTTAKVIHFACQYAQQQGRRTITCVDKSNIIPSHGFFRKIFTNILSTHYPELNTNYFYVDTFVYEQIKNPQQFDVVVAPNLVGDIISKNGIHCQGGLGLAPSANIGDHHAMFEPVHSSALSLAGKNKANPMGMLLSVALMFHWLSKQKQQPHLSTIGWCLEEAVRNTIKEQILTPDLIEPEKARTTDQVYHSIMKSFKEIYLSQKETYLKI